MDTASSFPLPNLKPLLGRALERALDRLLALDPATRAALKPLEGRRVSLTLSVLRMALEIVVREGRLVIGPAGKTEPDLRITSTLDALLSRLLPGGEERGMGVGRVTMSGDAGLAQQLQRLAKNFNPDWEEPFAQVFGDVLGQQIAQALRMGLAWGRDSVAALARDGAEFLTEESRDLAARAELEGFYDDVDALRDRLARLEARLNRLRERLPEARRG